LQTKGGKYGGPLSARSVADAHKVLHVAIKKAVKNEVLARNVVAVRSPPTVGDALLREELRPAWCAAVLAYRPRAPRGP
jgi:hypothetical protein